MDPNVVYNRMLDESLPATERREAAHDLNTWLTNGGFVPRTGIAFGGNTAARFYVRRKIEFVLTAVGA